MKEKEIKELATCIENGTNPVEVAGHGRGTTHKGYLTWLLNSGRWGDKKDARKAIDLLVDSASITCPENDSYQEIAQNWKRDFPESFWCEYERGIGDKKSRVDLLLCTNPENNMTLPIELKVDDKLEYDQLEKYSSGREDEIGLVFLLGSSSVRDDSFHNVGCWKWITINDILTAWECLYESMPPRGKEWYDSLKNELLRLNCAFEIKNYDRSICDSNDFGWWKYGYRSEKHLYYSRLHSVKEILNINGKFGKWALYDGGYNTVLNLNYFRKNSEYSWVRVPGREDNYYWEFNDNKLVLKVEYAKENGDDGIRTWIREKKLSIKESGIVWPGDVTPHSPPSRGGKWYISVFQWILPFDSAQSVAGHAVKIIELVDNSKILDN